MRDTYAGQSTPPAFLITLITPGHSLHSGGHFVS